MWVTRSSLEKWRPVCEILKLYGQSSTVEERLLVLPCLFSVRKRLSCSPVVLLSSA